jgi:uncharacterized protein YegL
MFSLGLHAAALASLWGKPLQFLQVAAPQEGAQVTRVRRASYDYFVAEPESPASSNGEPAHPSAAEVSKALLQTTGDQLATGNEAPAPSPRVDDRRPDAPQVDGSQQGSDLSGSGQFYQSLVERAPKQIDAADGRANGNTGQRAGGGNHDASGRGGPNRDGASEARQLLARAGAMPDASPEPPEASNVEVTERAAPDRRLLDAPSSDAALDLADTALADTTQLEIPEHLDNDFNYYLARYDPPNEPGYFRVDIAAKKSLSKLPAMPKDVIFLIDTSDSISRQWVEQVVRGVKQSLPTLNKGDRFNIVLFDEQPRFFSTSGMKSANPGTLNAARDFLAGTASEGYTDVNAALRQLLVRQVDADRVYEIILLSDGKPTRGVMDTRQLINIITRDNDRVASIYCVGVGQDQNRELLDFLAYRNRGFSRFINDQGQAAQRIVEMLSRLRYPLIKNVKLHTAGVDSEQVFPRFLPNIHEGQTLSAFGRYDQAGEFTMRLTGMAGGEQVDFTFTRDLSLAAPDDQSIARGWGFWKLHHLYSEIIRRGPSETLKQRIDHLQRKYDLKTVY